MRAEIHCRRSRLVPLLAALAVTLLCCRERAPDAAWPPGLLLSADTAALTRLLDEIAQLAHTPLGRTALELRAKVPACAQVEGSVPGGDLAALFASLRCADAAGPLAAFHAARGERDLLFALPGDPGARPTGSADLDGPSARIALHWPVLAGPLADLLPGEAPAGPARLARAERVAHAHLRAAGPLDLAALVPEGSQGDRMFRLRSELFGAAVLDGRVELALYLPEPGAAMPRVALALGIRHAGVAEAAMNRFLDEVEATWRLRRVPFAQGPAHGACLPELQLVPELAPCYALADSSLVLGWNPASLRHALASETDPSAEGSDAPTGPAAARADLDLAGVAAADARLAAARGVEGSEPHWPWRRVRAEASRRDGVLEVLLALEASSS